MPHAPFRARVSRQGIHLQPMRLGTGTAKHDSRALPTVEPRHAHQCLLGSDMFRSFMDFCRSCGVRRFFLKKGSGEEIRLRAWLKVADPTIHTELFASADWQYIAPNHRQEHDPAILVPLIEDV